MFAKCCPKVTLKSCLSRESYDAKFGMDECARDNYGVTLSKLKKKKKKKNCKSVSKGIENNIDLLFLLKSPMIIYTTADKRSSVLDYDYEIFYIEELRSNTSKLF